MGRIYREARNFIAWLDHGPGSEDTVFKSLNNDGTGDEAADFGGIKLPVSYP
jgi:hypothetical protein